MCLATGKYARFCRYHPRPRTQVPRDGRGNSRSPGCWSEPSDRTCPARSEGQSRLKRRVSRALGKYVVNPFVKLVAGYVPWWSLLETIGRKSRRPWRNPVGNGIDGDTFWIVAEHGHQSGYVKNIKRNPRVRLRVGGRWRSGTAQVLDGDDPRARQRTLRPVNAAFVRLMGTDLLTVRINLDP